MERVGFPQVAQCCCIESRDWILKCARVSNEKPPSNEVYDTTHDNHGSSDTLPPTHLNMMATTSFVSVTNANPHTIPNSANPSPPQSYSPHTPPSANISPTNYYPHLHVRQLRPPKQPLYTPACLRPTDREQGRDIPERPRPPYTPPQSKENSFDSGKSGFGLAAMPMSLPSPEEDVESLRRGLSRAGSQVVDEDPGDVTGPPTMAHWKVRSSSLPIMSLFRHLHAVLTA